MGTKVSNYSNILPHTTKAAMDTLPLELIQEFDLEIKELIHLALTNRFFYHHIPRSSIKINKRLVVETEHCKKNLSWIRLLNNVVVKNISLIT